MAYRLEYAPRAWKDIRAIRDRVLRRRIEAALARLREEPRPAGAKRLAGQEELMRIRVGDWRILYELREREVVVLVVRIGPRGEVYERQGWGNGGCGAPILNCSLAVDRRENLRGFPRSYFPAVLS